MAAPMVNEGNGFHSSKLGTKEYWDSAYEEELKNFHDIGDVGEVWFGFDSVERVVRWMDRSEDVRTDASILDLGCGNGMLLVELHKEGFTDLTGVDYSQAAIDLAKAVAEAEDTSIKYERGDLLDLDNPENLSCLSNSWEICLDKGTYDAVSLNPENAQLRRQQYVNSVRRLVKTDGLFIITSCNWTKEELIEQFKGFTLFKEIPTPTFQFGGQVGRRETALVFRRS